MHFGYSFVSAAAACFGWGAIASGAALTTAAKGSIVNPDRNDAFEGATVTGKSGTWWSGNPGNAQDSAGDMFGGVTDWHGRPGMTHFDGTGKDKIWTGPNDRLGPYDGLNITPPYVEFATAAPVSIGGVRVTSTAAPLLGGRNVGHHSIVRFRLYASSDGGATYSHLLSNVQLYDMPQAGQSFHWDNPNYLTEYDSTDIVITDYFAAPVEYQHFRAEFHVTNRGYNDFWIGEIDALPVPEPTSIAALSLGAGAMLLRRRRGSTVVSQE